MKLDFVYSFLQNNSYLLPLGIFALTVITLALTLIPAGMLSHNQIFSYDKLGHMLLFGSWTLLLGIYHSIAYTNNTNLLVIFLLGISFGIFIEILQYSLPFLNRHADIYDILFDAIGCLLAVWVLKIFIPKK